MRRTISILLVIFGLSTISAGIWKFFPPFKNTLSPPHIISALIFAILLIIHVWLNRKQVIKYFQKLKWWWILVGIGFLLVVWISIGPIFFMNE